MRDCVCPLPKRLPPGFRRECALCGLYTIQLSHVTGLDRQRLHQIIAISKELPQNSARTRKELRHWTQLCESLFRTLSCPHFSSNNCLQQVTGAVLEAVAIGLWHGGCGLSWSLSKYGVEEFGRIVTPKWME